MAAPLRHKLLHQLARRGRSRYGAFTLVELLVVIAVIGVLVAMLLPAIQSAREAGRRVQCLNSVRQVALAVLDFEHINGKLPAAGRFGPLEDAMAYSPTALHMRVDLKAGTNHSWVVSVLPFMEQQVLYKQFDPARHVAANPERPQAAQPAALLCPSDDALGRMYGFRTSSEGETTPFGKANIAAFVSPFHIDDYDTAGAICLYGQELRQITDGTSRTVMLGEIRTRENERDQRGAWALPWSGASLLSVDAHPPWYPLGQSESSNSRDSYTFDESSRGSTGFTQTPNSKQFDVLYECPDLAAEQLELMPCTNHPGYTSAAPRSKHPGGVTTAYLDGSGHFLRDDIDEIAFAYLVATADEQLRDVE
jgi:prepilin-type N-terminal cleavage/methylation domain-containing protein